jgi:hypothetical protein
MRFFLVLFLIYSCCYAQAEYEREHRIKGSQFPTLEKEVLVSGDRIKQRRFYKEIDNSEVSYILKFKKDRLRYFMNFNPKGRLQNMGFRIKEIDVPSDVYANMLSYLTANFEKSRISRMYQEYYPAEGEAVEKTIRDAFQNMLLPDIMYKLMLTAKKDKKRAEYEAYFDAKGNFMKIRQALPANYDHILY